MKRLETFPAVQVAAAGAEPVGDDIFCQQLVNGLHAPLIPDLLEPAPDQLLVLSRHPPLAPS